MSGLVLTLFGEGDDLDALQMALRAAAVFLLMIPMLRVAGRRAIGQHRVFDASTAVLVGSVLGRAVVGASPFWPTVGAGVAIVVMHRLVGMACVRWPWAETLVSGDKRELVQDGRIDADEMRKGLVTRRDLDEAVREKTGDEKTPIERGVLERDGSIMVKVAGGK